MLAVAQFQVDIVIFYFNVQFITVMKNKEDKK